MIQREDPINEQTIIRIKAHIPGPRIGVSQIPRDEEATEGGNTDEDIDQYTLVLKEIAQPSS